VEKNMIVYHAYRKDAPEFYIGKTIHTLDHRRRQHENESQYDRGMSDFHRALKKYGIDNFQWVVLERCGSIKEMNNAEIRWISLVRECGHKLYNMTDGGDGGGYSDYWKNKNLPKETREKISISLKEYYKRNGNPKKGKTCIGHPHTEETKLKLSIAKIGHDVSPQAREKLRMANLGKKLQPHVLEMLKKKFSGKNNPSAKPVFCITTGEIYDYAKQAAIKYNLDLSAIIKCCRGKAKKHKGMEFKYWRQL